MSLPTNFKAGDDVQVYAEFFDMDADGLCDCKVIGPAAPKIVDGHDYHEECLEVCRNADGKRIAVHIDFVQKGSAMK